MRRYKRNCLVLVAMSVSACASIVSDNESVTYIETEPEVARCELHGHDFERVVTTPNSINLPAEAAPVKVACKADGYREATTNLDTSMDGWILGNAIFGGIIGIAVDAARGAGQKYPPKISMILEPESFVSEIERDRWYDKHKERVAERWRKAVETVETECSDEPSDFDCPDRLKEVKEKQKKELVTLERHRMEAKIRQAGS